MENRFLADVVLSKIAITYRSCDMNVRNVESKIAITENLDVK